MTSKTLRSLRERWLSALVGAGIALGVLGLLFGAASLSRAAPLSQMTPGVPDCTGFAYVGTKSAGASTGSDISGQLTQLV